MQMQLTDDVPHYVASFLDLSGKPLGENREVPQPIRQMPISLEPDYSWGEKFEATAYNMILTARNYSCNRIIVADGSLAALNNKTAGYNDKEALDLAYTRGMEWESKNLPIFQKIVCNENYKRKYPLPFPVHIKIVRLKVSENGGETQKELLYDFSSPSCSTPPVEMDIEVAHWDDEIRKFGAQYVKALQSIRDHLTQGETKSLKCETGEQASQLANVDLVLKLDEAVRGYISESSHLKKIGIGITLKDARQNGKDYITFEGALMALLDGELFYSVDANPFNKNIFEVLMTLRREIFSSSGELLLRNIVHIDLENWRAEEKRKIEAEKNAEQEKKQKEIVDSIVANFLFMQQQVATGMSKVVGSPPDKLPQLSFSLIAMFADIYSDQRQEIVWQLVAQLLQEVPSSQRSKVLTKVKEKTPEWALRLAQERSAKEVSPSSCIYGSFNPPRSEPVTIMKRQELVVPGNKGSSSP